MDGSKHFGLNDVPYRMLVERVPAVIYLDVPDEVSSALYVSPQVEDMLGYAREEWLTDPELWVKTLHSDDREHVLAEHEHARETGETFISEYRLVARDGRVVWVRDEATLSRDEEGRPRFWQGIAVDITERKLAEEARRETEEMLRVTFEIAAVGMAHTAPDGKWLRINRTFCEIIGYEQEELLESTFWDITPPEEMDAARKRVRRMLDGGTGSYAVERRYVRKDGSRVWTNLNVSLARKTTSGEPNYFMCVAEDITEQKLSELVPNPLTPREMEVLREVAAGRKNREIAGEIAHSLGTVKSDIQSILKKLGAEDRRQAADRAIEIGLIHPPRY